MTGMETDRESPGCVGWVGIAIGLVCMVLVIGTPIYRVTTALTRHPQHAAVADVRLPWFCAAGPLTIRGAALCETP